MATIIVIPEAVQGSMARTLNVPSGQPRFVTFKLISSVFATDATVTWSLFVEQSFDNGQTFSVWIPQRNEVGGLGPGIGKFGTVGDGLPEINLSFDGAARVARITITTNKSFSWGLSATV